MNKYMRSHTGGFMTMGKWGAKVKYIKQKKNTKAEIFGVDNILTQVIWTWYFLKGKGYEICDNIIYQYNHISIKLEDNDRQSNRNSENTHKY